MATLRGNEPLAPPPLPAGSAKGGASATPEQLAVARDAAQRRFAATVARRLCQYARRVLPASLLLHARRQRPPQRVVSRVRFCIEADERGVPRAPEPLRELELWCDLKGWGRVHVGNVPVPYDRSFACAFPTIVEAVLHYVPAGAPPPASATEPAGRPLLPWALEGAASGSDADSSMRTHARHVVSLQLEEEESILEMVDARLHSAARWGAATAGRPD